jgi:AcrR family transcriptional regulator
MTEREKAKEITKSRVRKFALALFSVNGYYQTSIAEITTNARISKGLFYHYYSSKESLLEEIILESIESLLNYLPHINEEDFNDDKLVYFINNVILPSLDEDKTHWEFLIFLLSQQPLYKTAFNYLTKSSAFIEYENILRGFFKEKGYENPDIEVKLFTSSLMGICIQYISNPSDIPIKKIMSQFTNNIITKKAKT